MKLRLALVSFSSLSFTLACGELNLSEEKGSKETSAAQAQPKADGSLSLDEVDQMVQQGEIDDFLGQCLKSWATDDFPFTRQSVSSSVSLKMSTDDVKYKDKSESESDRLVVIDITSPSVDDVKLELMNPKGWYCVNLAMSNGDDVSIKSHCQSNVIYASAVDSNIDDLKIKSVCPKPKKPDTPKDVSDAVAEAPASGEDVAADVPEEDVVDEAAEAPGAGADAAAKDEAAGDAEAGDAAADAGVEGADAVADMAEQA